MIKSIEELRQGLLLYMVQKQTRMAHLEMEIGVTIQTLRKIINGRSKAISSSTYIKICFFLKKNGDRNFDLF
jgi:DNA-binding Xre family transcriptional regulator